jgi:pSer/pThr/pTyr-binding forkhead associated (FHA) protein
LDFHPILTGTPYACFRSLKPLLREDSMPEPASPTLEFPTLTPVGRQAGAPTVLLTQPYTIAGSSSRAMLRLEAKTVSRFHCIIIRSGRDVFIRDLASRNGTYVNKNKITERTLHGGDLIHIGDRPFQFRRRGTRNLPPSSLPESAKLAGDDWAGVDISGKTLLIGRREGCDVLLDSDDVAPAHAIIFAMDGAHHLLDIHSPAGTRLNGLPISDAQKLSPGDEIEIAGSVMRYEPLGAAATTRESALEDSDALIPISLQEEPAAEKAAIAPPPEPEAVEQAVAEETEEPEKPAEPEEEPISLADLRDTPLEETEIVSHERAEIAEAPAPILAEEPIIETPILEEPIALEPIAQEPIAEAPSAAQETPPESENPPLALAGEQEPLPPLRDEAENNPQIQEPSIPLAEEPIALEPELPPAEVIPPEPAPEEPAAEIPVAGEEQIAEPATPIVEETVPLMAEEPPVSLREDLIEEKNPPHVEPDVLPHAGEARPDLVDEPQELVAETNDGSDVDDLALAALNETPSEPTPALPANQIEAPAPVNELAEVAESPRVAEGTRETVEPEIHATMNVPSAPPEESLTSALAADAATDAILPVDLPELKAEAASIADQEESTMVELDGAVSPNAEAPVAPLEDQEPENMVVSETAESPATQGLDLGASDDVVAPPIERQATFPVETVVEPLTGSPPAPAPEFSATATSFAAASAVETDFNNFNALIDSLGAPPAGVPVIQSAAPPPAVQQLASAEVARAIGADTAAVPRSIPQPKPIITDRNIPAFSGPGPATHGKVTVGFEMVAPPVRQEDVFAIPGKDSIWKVPPDPGFGVPSHGTVAGAGGSGTLPGQANAGTRTSPQRAVPPRPVPPRRVKARFWILLFLIGALVVLWSQHRYHSAGDMPVIQTPPMQNDAQRASMRQVPP